MINMKRCSNGSVFCLFLMTSIILSSLAAHGKINKFAFFCETEKEDKSILCFRWVPILPKVKGWYQVKELSSEKNMNAQAPEGDTFRDAGTIIYAKALLKEETSDLATLQEMIDDDHQKFKSTNHGILIRETETITSKSGMVFRSFDYEPKDKGNWERVSFGEEKDKDGGEYFTVITISSRTQDGLKKYLTDYEEFVKNY